MGAVTSITELFDNLFATTWQQMKGQYTDQIFTGTPFWFMMKEKGMLESVVGYRYLTETLRYAASPRVGYIGKGGTVELSDHEFMTVATFNWKYLVDSIVRFGVDEQQNSGKAQIMNYIEAKLETSRDSIADRIETDLFGLNAASTLSFLGLQDLIADDPTTSTEVGGINQSTNSWWRNQTKNMNGGSFATNGQKEMRTMFNNCSKNLTGKKPDLWIGGQSAYEKYEDSILTQKRIVNQKLGDAGFENVEFKGVPVTWSPKCADTRLYLLTMGNLKFKYDPRYFMEMTEWKPVPDQVNDRAAQIMIAGELTTNRRAAHGVMYNINTA